MRGFGGLRRMGLAIAVACAMPSPVLADPLDDRVVALLAWVAERTGYDAAGISVTIAFASAKVVNIVAHGKAYGGETDVEAVAIGASILLADGFVLGRDDNILVHELTHVLQHTSGARFTCTALQELEAYTIAAAFTRETGIGVEPAGWFLATLTCHQPWEGSPGTGG